MAAIAVLRVVLLACTVTTVSSVTITPSADAVTVRRGEQLQMSCDVSLTAGESLQEVRWYRGSISSLYGSIDVPFCGFVGHPCSTTFTSDNRGTVRYAITESNNIWRMTLTIASSVLEDSTTFYCAVVKGSHKSASITVTVYYLPNTSYPTCTPSPHQPGTIPSALRCSAEVTRPAVSLEWTIENIPRLPLQNASTIHGNQVVNTLDLSSLDASQKNSLFICYMTSEAYPGFTRNCTFGPIIVPTPTREVTSQAATTVAQTTESQETSERSFTTAKTTISGTTALTTTVNDLETTEHRQTEESLPNTTTSPSEQNTGSIPPFDPSTHFTTDTDAPQPSHTFATTLQSSTPASTSVTEVITDQGTGSPKYQTPTPSKISTESIWTNGYTTTTSPTSQARETSTPTGYSTAPGWSTLETSTSAPSATFTGQGGSSSTARTTPTETIQTSGSTTTILTSQATETSHPIDNITPGHSTLESSTQTPSPIAEITTDQGFSSPSNLTATSSVTPNKNIPTSGIMTTILSSQARETFHPIDYTTPKHTTLENGTVPSISTEPGQNTPTDQTTASRMTSTDYIQISERTAPTSLASQTSITTGYTTPEQTTIESGDSASPTVTKHSTDQGEPNSPGPGASPYTYLIIIGVSAASFVLVMILLIVICYRAPSQGKIQMTFKRVRTSLNNRGHHTRVRHSRTDSMYVNQAAQQQPNGFPLQAIPPDNWPTSSLHLNHIYEDPNSRNHTSFPPPLPPPRSSINSTTALIQTSALTPDQISIHDVPDTISSISSSSLDSTHTYESSVLGRLGPAPPPPPPLRHSSLRPPSPSNGYLTLY